MRMLAISLCLWILILPSIVASFLILTALAAFVTPPYFAVVWIGVALQSRRPILWTISCCMASGPLCRVRFEIYSACSTRNSPEEKSNEASITTQVRP